MAYNECAAQQQEAPSRALVQVRNVSKRYGRGGKRADDNAAAATRALDNVTFSLAAGEFVGIMGPSGSGKSTLLNCLSTIDAPTSGHIEVNGCSLGGLRGRNLARFRRDELGFIFQDANLLDTLTAYENIALALTIQKVKPAEVDIRVKQAARTLGIVDVLEKRPYEMSGGQRQRVAAARATVTRPSLVLADEPTGALDSKSARTLLESLEQLNRMGSTILMVTHDASSASYCNRVMFLKDGQLAGQIARGAQEARAAYYERISARITELGEVEEACDAC